MIKFFRKIRQKLLSENKLSKYLIYAIGEIFLVVIGILIALSINNWNEEKANEKKIESTLKQIQVDLLNDIQETSTNTAYLERNLDLANEFLNESKQPYYFIENFSDFTQISLNFLPFVISDQAFLRLKDQINILPESYNSILKLLNQLYVENGALVKSQQEVWKDQTHTYTSRLYDTYNWMEDYQNHNYTDEVKTFFMASDINRRQLVRTKKTYRDLLIALKIIQDQSLNCYLEIRKLLNDNQPLPDIIKRFETDSLNNNIRNFTGTYKFQGSDNEAFEIELKNNLLFWKMFSSENVNVESSMLVERGKDSLGLFIYEDIIFKLKRDSLERIEGIYIIDLEQNPQGTFFKKVLKEK